METCSCCFVVVVPYHYALGNEALCHGALYSPHHINVTILAQFTRNHASDGLIDATGNMQEDRVFIYNGANDTVVTPGHAPIFI